MSQARPVALLTGATSGIGQWTALGLAKAGYHVIGVGRDARRAGAFEDWIKAQLPDPGVEVILADLSLMAEVKRLAAAVRERAPALGLLVNNAGLVCDRRRETAEGHELTLAVNHLAPFLLTRELMPLLGGTPGARVVNIGSSSSDRARFDLEDLDWRRRVWSGVNAYGQSKLALMIATFEWARREANPTFNVVHPGSVGTRIGDLGGVIGLGWDLVKPFLLTPEKGARTSIHVATSPAVANVTGRYFKRSALAKPNPLAADPRLGKALWARTEDMLG